MRLSGLRRRARRPRLDRIAAVDTAVAGLEDTNRGQAAPGSGSRTCCGPSPAWEEAIARAWPGEIGPAPHARFGSREELASWVTLCLGSHKSAGKPSESTWFRGTASR
ncbi:MAG TPA: hypothetical protein VMK13_06700 [Streptosporangiaceae bacterium]|nr:hypothetical protein [Streptosporangiaceae bacterium]